MALQLILFYITLAPVHIAKISVLATANIDLSIFLHMPMDDLFSPAAMQMKLLSPPSLSGKKTPTAKQCLPLSTLTPGLEGRPVLWC